MTASDRQLQFFKNYIKEKLNTVKNDIGQIRYKLYVAMVEECNDYGELREMAELEMQIDMIAYTNGELAGKLKELNTDFETVKNIDNTVEYRITEEKKHENNEIFEDLEDDDVMDAMAHMLMQRITREPEEEKRRDELLDFDFEEEPSVDDIDIDEIADDFGDLDDIISEDEAELGMEVDYESLNEMNLEDTIVAGDLVEDTEDDEDDDFDINEDDFGDLGDEEDEERDIEEDTDDEEDGEYNPSDFGEETKGLSADTEDDEFDVDDSEFGDLEDEDDDFDIDEDDLGDLGDDDDEFDIDDSEFGDLDDEDEDETGNNGFSSFDIDEVDFDELGELTDESEESDEFDFDDSEFGDFDDEDIDESEFGDLDDIEIDEDDFGDLEDSDDINEDDFGNLDDEFDDSGFEDLIDDEDEFDIDINDFGDLGDDDDTTDVSKAKSQKPIITDDSSDYINKRKVTKENVFENGTDKGKKTQEAFNTMLKIGGITAGFGKKAAKTIDKGSKAAGKAAVKATEKSVDKLSKSSMLKLPEDDDDFIDF